MASTPRGPRPQLPTELKSMILALIHHSRELALLAQADSTFQVLAETRLYRYLDVSDDDMERTTMCLESIRSRPTLASYVQTIYVDMWNPLEKYPKMMLLLFDAFEITKGVKKIHINAYSGSPEPFINSYFKRLQVYSSFNFLTAPQLEELSREGPGLMKLNTIRSPELPNLDPLCLQLDSRHNETMKYIGINLSWKLDDEEVIGIVKRISQRYLDLATLRIVRTPLKQVSKSF